MAVPSTALTGLPFLNLFQRAHAHGVEVPTPGPVKRRRWGTQLLPVSHGKRFLPSRRGCSACLPATAVNVGSRSSEMTGSGDDLALCECTGPGCNHRHPDASFIDIAFHAGKRVVARGVLACWSAIVAEKDDQSVFTKALLIEMLE